MIKYMSKQLRGIFLKKSIKNLPEEDILIYDLRYDMGQVSKCHEASTGKSEEKK